jgi:hypothetical protein
MLNSMRGRLLSHAHLSRKRAMRNPLSTRHRRRLFQHPINLFQRKALGLRDEKVCVNQTQQTKRAPEEEDLRSKIDTTTYC